MTRARPLAHSTPCLPARRSPFAGQQFDFSHTIHKLAFGKVRCRRSAVLTTVVAGGRATARGGAGRLVELLSSGC